jgi:hypothetical protein
MLQCPSAQLFFCHQQQVTPLFESTQANMAKKHLCDSIDPLSHTPSHTKCQKGLKSNHNPK